MNCREFQDQMIDVAFGEAGRSTDFDRHLESCAGCKKDFAMAQFAANGIEDAPSAPAPSLSNERLHQAILSRELKSRPTWLPRIAFAGAAAVLALAAWMGFSRQPEITRPGEVLANITPGNDVIDVPEGPIEIPEDVPEIVAPAISQSAERTTPVRRNQRIGSYYARVRAPRPAATTAQPENEELLAVVMSGAESALEQEAMPAARGGAMSEAMSPGGAFAEPAPVTTEKPIVVIQGRGQATERPSDDVAIGG
jgi:hypothetical protein